MKFPLIVGYQIIECTHNSKKISKFNFKIQDPNKQDKKGKVSLTQDCSLLSIFQKY